MNALRAAQRAYDGQGDTQGDWNAAQGEAVSERVSELEKDPAAIERALELIDCDHAAELMPLRVQAHLTGDWSGFRQRETTLLAAALLKRAKHEIAAEFAGQRRRSSHSFADLLQGRRAQVSP